MRRDPRSFASGGPIVWLIAYGIPVAIVLAIVALIVAVAS